MATIEYQTITTQELRDELDALSVATLGLSAEEFMRDYQAGKLDLKSPAISQLAVLARLLDAATRKTAA